MKQNPITRGAFALTSIALTAFALLSFANFSVAEDQSAPAIPVPGKPAVAIPFAESLRRADVEVATMKDGQHESLILGNGDLYGIVWEKDNGLFMRITKNNIWDARVDTSKDWELPRVDPVTREVTGLDGAPPSYSLTYPQPRCAVALRLGQVPEKMSGHLNLEKALVTIKSGEQTHTNLACGFPSQLQHLAGLLALACRQSRRVGRSLDFIQPRHDPAL